MGEKKHMVGGISRKTLERLGGALLETRVPASYSGLYRDGAHGEHCIFRYDLGAE